MAKRHTLVNIYNNYLQDNLPNSTNYVTKEDFKEINLLFFKLLSKEIIENGYVYKVPSGLGEIFIKKFKPSKKRAIDFKMTNALYAEHNLKNPDNKKIIYHKNNHSFGYAGRWYWKKTKAILPNKSLYKLQPVRSNKRALAKSIKNNNTINKYIG
jgi:hypothetical protein